MNTITSLPTTPTPDAQEPRRRWTRLLPLGLSALITLLIAVGSFATTPASDVEAIVDDLRSRPGISSVVELPATDRPEGATAVLELNDGAATVTFTSEGSDDTISCVVNELFDETPYRDMVIGAAKKRGYGDV